MQWMINILTGLKSLFQKQRVENELDEELDSYLQASVAEKEKSGMTPEKARHAALVELGSRSVVKHQVWSSRWESTLDSLLLDMKISFRTLVEQQCFRGLAAVGAVGAFRHRDLALIHRARLAARDVLEKLRALRITFGVDDMCRHVGMSFVEHTDAREVRRPAFTV